jgi:chlorobactene glucosyltransferase
MINILIVGTLAIINAIWTYIYISSVISHRKTPKLTNSQDLEILSTHLNVKNDESNAFFNQYRDTNVPSVSIIVPARNEEHEIYRSLTSLLGQNYPDYEIIAIDDNSSDNTLTIMQSIKEEYLGSVNMKSKTKLRSQSNNLILDINNTPPNIHKKSKENLTLTVSYPSISNKATSSYNYENKNERLKIISLKERPEGWTAKTWASQQGFLQSKGDILIFTDADTYYLNKDTIMAAISYLQNENLDILTGFPFIELRDFWSKVIMPVWKVISNTFGVNAIDINNPKSDAANLNGCFIVMKRKVFQDLGTYEAVRDSIREDEALGMKAKKSGYRIRGVCMEGSLSALWSRNLHTLWWGIARTIIPIFLDKKRRASVVVNIAVLFLLGVLPFIVLPFALNNSMSRYFDSAISHFAINSNYSNPTQYTFELSTQLSLLILPLNLSACFMLSVGSVVVAKYEFKVSSKYAIISPLAAIFLFVACVTHILSLMCKGGQKTVEWQGRTYYFHDDE